MNTEEVTTVEVPELGVTLRFTGPPPPTADEHGITINTMSDGSIRLKREDEDYRHCPFRKEVEDAVLAVTGGGHSASGPPRPENKPHKKWGIFRMGGWSLHLFVDSGRDGVDIRIDVSHLCGEEHPAIYTNVVEAVRGVVEASSWELLDAGSRSGPESGGFCTTWFSLKQEWVAPTHPYEIWTNGKTHRLIKGRGGPAVLAAFNRKKRWKGLEVLQNFDAPSDKAAEAHLKRFLAKTA